MKLLGELKQHGIRISLFVWLVLLGGFPSAWAQLQINPSMALEDVVLGLQGEGVIISNVTSPNGSISSNSPIAAFIHGKGNFLGIQEGLMLTSGSALNALGPNDQSGVTQQNSGSPMVDPDLEQLESELPLFDVAIVEFDITVASTELTFNYVFASDEYPEFVFENYNDVFGFFLSGPGINGTLNLATVNGDPVSIDNINSFSNSQFYRANGDGSSPGFFRQLQYDGLTTVLRAEAQVIPCETYHIKLAIADAGDGIFDSGVFIEKGSISSEIPPLIELTYEDPEYPFAVESCNYGEFKIFRPEVSDLSETYIYEYELSGSAIEGVDFPVQTGEVVIPANQTFGTVRIDPQFDEILEGEEEVVLTLLDQCELIGELATEVMPVRDFLPFEIEGDRICFGDTIQLNSDYSEPFALVWGEDDYLSSTMVNAPFAYPHEDRFFDFTIDYQNGCVAFDSVAVWVTDPRAYFRVFPLEDYTSLEIAPNNLSTGAEFYAWDLGDGTTTDFFEPTHTYTLDDPQQFQKFTISLTALTADPDCQHTYDTTITVFPFFIPNIITPNADRFNDDFEVDGIMPGFWSFDVYNRWGKPVYSTDTYENDWEATGQEDGLYYFLLENPPGDRSFKGWVQVIR